MGAQDTPKGAPTSNGFIRDAGVSRLLQNGRAKRAVWFEALPTEWQAIVDEDSEPGYTTVPLK